MKIFLQGGLFGLLFSSIAVWFLKFSRWAIFPEISVAVFILGGALFGGLFHLLMGNVQDVSSE
jgi:hypothetical protein